jgi:hypothetical protein
MADDAEGAADDLSPMPRAIGLPAAGPAGSFVWHLGTTPLAGTLPPSPPSQARQSAAHSPALARARPRRLRARSREREKEGYAVRIARFTLLPRYATHHIRTPEPNTHSGSLSLPLQPTACPFLLSALVVELGHFPQRPWFSPSAHGFSLHTQGCRHISVPLHSPLFPFPTLCRAPSSLLFPSRCRLRTKLFPLCACSPTVPVSPCSALLCSSSFLSPAPLHSVHLPPSPL